MHLYDQSPLYLFYISTVAGLATTAGCLLVLFMGNPPEKLLAALLAGAGGVMLAVVLIDLIPLGLSYKQPSQFLAGFFLGVIFMAAADKIMRKRNPEQSSSRHSHLKRMGILIASGIALHDIPEGMAIAVGQESAGHLGMLIAIGIALHNLPEGMATATPLIMAGIRKDKILALTLGIAFFTPLGAAIAKLALGAVHSSLCFFVSLAAGAMTFLVFAELWPISGEKYPHWALFGGTLGFLFFAVISLYLPH
ncbi:MAG: Zinc transporter ZupT [Candidatus Dichloromethanomonas elyunquensis]|nr:MAG: Zinc transporter ZupT [Candidatus Dichloromethanomonas elyunquensis]